MDKETLKLNPKDYIVWSGGLKIENISEDNYIEIELSKVYKITSIPNVVLQREIKSQYRCGDDRKPKWVSFYLDSGEIISEEKYNHQDENFSHLCTSDYCRCQN